MITAEAKIKKDIRVFSKTQLEELVVALGEKKNFVQGRFMSGSGNARSCLLKE